MYRTTVDEIKKRLSNYSAIRVELDNLEDRLERLKSEEPLPPMRPGNGSKPTGGTGNQQERSVIRHMEYEERHGAEIEAKRNELRYIENLINAVSDPMERMVLRIRYTDSETAKPMQWRDVAMTIYKDDSDAKNARNLPAPRPGAKKPTKHNANCIDGNLKGRNDCVRFCLFTTIVLLLRFFQKPWLPEFYHHRQDLCCVQKL